MIQKKIILIGVGEMGDVFAPAHADHFKPAAPLLREFQAEITQH